MYIMRFFLICVFWILFDGGNADPAWGFAPMAGARMNCTPKVRHKTFGVLYV